MSKVNTGMTIDAGLLERIDSEATADRRSRSQMVEILCDEALAVRHGQTVARPRRASARQAGRIFSPPGSET